MCERERDKNFLTSLWLRVFQLDAICLRERYERERDKLIHQSPTDKELHRLRSEAAAAPGAARPDTHTHTHT